MDNVDGTSIALLERKNRLLRESVHNTRQNALIVAGLVFIVASGIIQIPKPLVHRELIYGYTGYVSVLLHGWLGAELLASLWEWTVVLLGVSSVVFFVGCLALYLRAPKIYFPQHIDQFLAADTIAESLRRENESLALMIAEMRPARTVSAWAGGALLACVIVLEVMWGLFGCP